MRKGNRFLPSILWFSGIILLIILFMQPFLIVIFEENIDMLFPKGIIALEQRNLLIILQILMLLVIIPVYIFTFIFSWKYRANNKNGVYDPDLIDNKLAEIAWWGIPLVMTVIASVLTWIKTDELDPFRPLASTEKPITIQVVALQWKWLFIYPEEKIASLNFLQFPEQTPIHFEITADAPMNSFWIPRLGGQIYAMPQMKTELHLIANEKGDFRGSSANLSGEGFAGMHFIARASSKEEYQQWIDSIPKNENALNEEKYQTLAAPSQNEPPQTFQLADHNLFHAILMKYMHPNHSTHHE